MQATVLSDTCAASVLELAHSFFHHCLNWIFYFAAFFLDLETREFASSAALAFLPFLNSPSGTMLFLL
jgi:hypothetical protein